MAKRSIGWLGWWLALGSVGCGAAHDGSTGSPHHGHGAHGDGHPGHGMTERFDDAARWAGVFDDPARDAWQRPDDVVRWLALAADARVADLGAGTGYFAVRLARAVPSGRVWAEDIEPSLVAYMQARAAREGLGNLFAVLGAPDDPLLPEPVDLVLVVDTYHHLPERTAFLRRLRDRLRPHARVVVVDFRETAAMGPPVEHRLSVDTVTREFAAAGYVSGGSLDTLREQYVLAFTVP